MSCREKLKEVFRFGDLFYSTQMLRYNTKSQYKTITGGIVSVILVIAILVGFSSMIKSVMDRTQITSTLERRYHPKPTPIELSYETNRFMFAVGLNAYPGFIPFDLNNGPQIFDVTFIKVAYGKKTHRQNSFSFEPCGLQHFTVDSESKHTFDTDRMFNWKCFKLGDKLNLQGQTSQIIKFFRIDVHKCRNTTQNNNKCAPQQTIDQTFKNYTYFNLNYNHIVTIINSNQPDYLKFFIGQQRQMFFSETLGSVTQLHIDDYTITTDKSNFLFEDLQIETGHILNNHDPITQTYSNPQGKYHMARILFFKSPISLYYKRSFLKITAVISYVGGLVAFATIVLFAFKVYTEKALQYYISVDLFEQYYQPPPPSINQQPNLSENKTITFGFINFASLFLYKLVRFFGKSGEQFKVAKEIDKSITEIMQHLDIKILLRRLIKIEQCIKHIMREDEINKIKNQRIITRKQGKQMRTLLNKNQAQGSSQRGQHNLGQNIQRDRGQTNNRMIIDQHGANQAYMSSMQRLDSQPFDPVLKGNGENGLEIVLNCRSHSSENNNVSVLMQNIP